LLVYQKCELTKIWKFESSRIHRFGCFRPKSIRYCVLFYLRNHRVANFLKFCHNWQKYLLIPLKHMLMHSAHKIFVLFLFFWRVQCVGHFFAYVAHFVFLRDVCETISLAVRITLALKRHI
jgi:hypothetical protein